MLRSIRRLAIVNRGEAAVRCLSAVADLGREWGEPITAIACYTEPDAASWFVREADEAISLGPATFTDGGGRRRSSYTDLNQLMTALAAVRADAVWAGWGFVAESAEFAARCEQAGITFIGPPSEVIDLLGDMTRARKLAESAGIPVVPWSGGAASVQIAAARHVEVQVIADGYGTVWAAGIRDSSIRRRDQKMIEESGCTQLDRFAEAELREAATRLCRAAGYRGVGTVEFLIDSTARRFMFMKASTQLQTGHPVTEMTTGLDLVKLQLHVARGGRLRGGQPPARGYAIEAHLNAENAERDFAPAPGRVSALHLPTGPGIRVDTGVAEGDQIAPEFDPAIAKIVVWGRNRDQALRRLRRGLAQTMAVVDGGTTNKAFLLALVDQPEVRAGTYDNHWLDQLTGRRAHLAPPHPVALVAAAVEAAAADQAAAQTNFFAVAARGRPQLPGTVGHRIRLRFRGEFYLMRVRDFGHGDYRIDTDGSRLDVNVRRLGRYERAVTCQGRRYRVVAAAHGPRLLVEVDGLPHLISRDDGDLVRSPAPAFLVAVLTSPGDTVQAGDPLVVLEAMKMETTITAPYPGTVRAVLAELNTQVEAGAPLVRLQPPEQAETDSGGPRADLASLACPGSATDCLDLAQTDAGLRAYLLGYDLSDDDARELGRHRAALLASPPSSDTDVLGGEHELLEIFADMAGLSRRVHEDAADEHTRSSQEYLHTYLASLDPERSGTPEAFRERLLAALTRYGVHSLQRTPELEHAMVRMYRAAGRLPTAAQAVIAILDRWRREPEALTAAAERDGRRPVLDRLISATQGRHPEVSDLAREVRFNLVDAPLLRAARAVRYAEIEDCISELPRSPSGERTGELIGRLVSFPLPMRARLRDAYRAADDVTRSRLLEARARRYYRIRELTALRCEMFGRHLTCLADYADDGALGGAVHLASAYLPLAELPAFASELGEYLRGLPEAHQVVVDVESWRGEPFVTDEQMAGELASVLAGTQFGRDLDRLDITVTSERGGTERADEHLRTQHFCYRQDGPGFTEDLLFRNMHPMLAERLELWRLSNFSLRRLPGAEDVYLFHAVANTNRKDERLIALAEVRDLTPARDSGGQVVGYPHMEGMLTQALADIRRALDERPARQRPLSNRVILYVRPVWDIPAATWRGLAHRLAPLAAGLGLEKVTVRVHTEDTATGERREAILDVDNLEDRGVTVRVRPLGHLPIQPLTEYRQKVLRSHRLGAPYPYELIRMLTPPVGAPADFPAGEFTEYDFPDGGGELGPVDRPSGRNRAGVVVGVISNFTELVPEGLRRVVILGDPTAGLGNLAEPECRLIIAAIDLAERLRIPVEWFAVSSGARISMDSGTENMDWVAAVLRRLVEFTQAGGEVNVVVTGINVGAQPYWNAEATMLMHTRGILVMTPASAMVLTGKSSLDYSGGVSAEDNLGIGGFERVMGPNGQAQYWAPTLAGACAVLLRHYDHSYVVPGELHPRRAPTRDPFDRDVCLSPHEPVPGSGFTAVGDIFSAELNGDRKKPFDMRSVMRAVTDDDHAPSERWARWRDAEMTIVWEARIGGFPVCLIGLESQTLNRTGFLPADGPPTWTSGTLFPQSARKVARAINAASGNRPVVVLANLSGFDGSPESMRKWQLEYGAEIGRAVTNFRGPIVLVVVSRYHGGAFVVFSKRLHEQMDTAAVAGSFASVIGGAPAAAVVLSREVTARTEQDPRVMSQRQRAGSASGKALADAHHDLAVITEAVRAEKLKEVADEFDSVHDIKRALRVGSVDHIIAPAELRPFIISALERRLADGQPVSRAADPASDARAGASRAVTRSPGRLAEARHRASRP